MKRETLNIKHNQGDIKKGLDVLNKKTSFGETNICEQTLNDLRGGSHQAYRDVYLAYKESIQVFLQKLLRSEDEAAELTQVIFVNVWEKRELIDPSRNIKSYLFSVAKNSALDHFKHRKVRDRYVQHEMHNDGLDYDSSDDMAAKETQFIIEIAVSRMPRIRRKVFEMSRMENMSNEEIAEKLKMNKYTVANHISHALKDIKELLALFHILFMMNI